ncbi:MAG: acyltransferase family protein [Leptonema sp. (in: bacteria)]
MKLNKESIKNYLINIWIPSANEVIFLHNLRILAVIMVIALHVFNVPKDYFQSKILSIISKNFEFATDILFVLAGFFAANFFYQKEITKKIIIKFYIQKILKILPIYIFTFFVYYHFISIEYNKLLKISQIHNSTEIELLLNLFKTKLSYFWGDLLFLSNYMPGRIINVGWNISAIVQYFLVVPWLFLLVQYLRVSKFLYWVVIYLIITTIRFMYYINHIDLEKIYFYSHTRFDSFIIGILIKEVLEDGYFRQKWNSIFKEKKLQILIFLYFFVSFYLIFVFYDPEFLFWDYFLKYNYNNLFLFIFIVYISFVEKEKFLYKIFNIPYFTFFSKISYTVFLLHEYFAILLTKNFSFTFGTKIDVFIFFIILLILSIILGYAFYLIFEQPFLIIKKKSRIEKNYL